MTTTTTMTATTAGLPRVHQGHAAGDLGGDHRARSGPRSTATRPRRVRAPPRRRLPGLPTTAMRGDGHLPEVVVDGEVLESDPPHRFVQTWRICGPRRCGRGLHPPHIGDRRERRGSPAHGDARAGRARRTWRMIGGAAGADGGRRRLGLGAQRPQVPAGDRRSDGHGRRPQALNLRSAREGRPRAEAARAGFRPRLAFSVRRSPPTVRRWCAATRSAAAPSGRSPRSGPSRVACRATPPRPLAPRDDALVAQQLDPWVVLRVALRRGLQHAVPLRLDARAFRIVATIASSSAPVRSSSTAFRYRSSWSGAISHMPCPAAQAVRAQLDVPAAERRRRCWSCTATCPC